MCSAYLGFCIQSTAIVDPRIPLLTCIIPGVRGGISNAKKESWSVRESAGRTDHGEYRKFFCLLSIADPSRPAQVLPPDITDERHLRTRRSRPHHTAPTPSHSVLVALISPFN